jgi:hypothetical protein
MTVTACCPVAALRPVVDIPRLGELPAVKATELQCLTPDAYDRLVARELILRAAFVDCTTILEELTDGN